MTLPLALSLIIAFLAVAHAWWATGRIWPAASASLLARAVIGDGRVRMPPPWQCAAVTAALAAVAAWPWVVLRWILHVGSDAIVLPSMVIFAMLFGVWSNRSSPNKEENQASSISFRSLRGK